MTLTRHGHHIPGTADGDEPRVVSRARCGGVNLCTVCRQDAGMMVVPGTPPDPRDRFHMTKYVAKPQYVLATEVTKDNAALIAKHFRGRVVTDQTANVTIGVMLPTMDNPLRVNVGQYVAEDENGISAQDAEAFEKEWEEYVPKPQVITQKLSRLTPADIADAPKGLGDRIREAADKMSTNERRIGLPHDNTFGA